jgi:hypothetical protein
VFISWKIIIDISLQHSKLFEKLVFSFFCFGKRKFLDTGIQFPPTFLASAGNSDFIEISVVHLSLFLFRIKKILDTGIQFPLTFLASAGNSDFI